MLSAKMVAILSRGRWVNRHLYFQTSAHLILSQWPIGIVCSVRPTILSILMKTPSGGGDMEVHKAMLIYYVFAV